MARCPKSGCSFYTTAQHAEDAVIELREHLKEAHGEDVLPDDVREYIGGKIKARAKERV